MKIAIGSDKSGFAVRTDRATTSSVFAANCKQFAANPPVHGPTGPFSLERLESLWDSKSPMATAVVESKIRAQRHSPLGCFPGEKNPGMTMSVLE